jgi:hypothetical protein
VFVLGNTHVRAVRGVYLRRPMTSGLGANSPRPCQIVLARVAYLSCLPHQPNWSPQIPLRVPTIGVAYPVFRPIPIFTVFMHPKATKSTSSSPGTLLEGGVRPTPEPEPHKSLQRFPPNELFESPECDRHADHLALQIMHDTTNNLTPDDGIARGHFRQSDRDRALACSTEVQGNTQMIPAQDLPTSHQRGMCRTRGRVPM